MKRPKLGPLCDVHSDVDCFDLVNPFLNKGATKNVEKGTEFKS